MATETSAIMCSLKVRKTDTVHIDSIMDECVCCVCDLSKPLCM
jgi:hypothetical protein